MIATSKTLGGAVCALAVSWSTHTAAQTAPSTEPPSPAAAAPPATAPPNTTPSPPRTAAPASTRDHDPDSAAEPPPRKRTRVGFGGGFGYFASSDSATGRSQVQAPGVALELHTGFPLADDWKLNLRFNWGLTEFHRTKTLVETANTIGEWTTGAYVSVFEWSIKKDEYALFRFLGSIFAYVGLLMPYAVAGALYVASPFAPTTYLGCDITGSYHLGDDDVNAFLEAGVGLVSYIHPKYGGLYGGVGPTVGFGTKLGFATIGVHGTWSPPGAHGEPLSQSSNVYVGGLTVTFGN